MWDATFERLTGRYITPATTPAASPRWRINIPDHPQFLAALKELIVQLASPEIWLERPTGGLTPDETAALAMQMYSTLRKDDTMLGVIVPIATANVPATMLLCDGSQYDGNDYPELWAVISSAFKLEFGGGKVLTMPDLRGKFIMGGDQESPQEFTEGGEAQVTLNVNQLPAHSHGNDPHYHTLVPGYTFNLDLEAPGAPDIFGAGVQLSKDTSAATVNIHNTGGGQAHNNLPPYYVLRYAMIATVG
jgi:microcystin-dependent protein